MRIQLLVASLLLCCCAAPAQTTGAKNPTQATGAQNPAQIPPARSAQRRGLPTPGIPPSWKRVTVRPLREFKPQEPKRIQFENGLIVFLQEDHELPLIDGTIRIRGGSRDEPAPKIGLVTIYGEVWRTGGTKTRTGDQLDDFLESRAARVETSGSLDSTFLAWSSLKEQFDQVFPVMVDLLQNPEFREDKIKLAKNQIDSVISRRNDDIDEIAGRESAKLAYGGDSPYARTPEYATIAAVTRDDLINWHQRTVVPANMIIGITGDFDSAAMEQKLRHAFGQLPKGERLQSTQTPFRRPRPGVYFIEKDDVNQSDISMIDLGIDRHNPDYFAVVAMNEILGGGFSSRLFAKIRTKEGLAYAVGGGVGSSFDHPGIARIGLSTKSATTVRSIEAVHEELSRIITDGVTADELKKAKDSILNSFIFEFDSKDKVLAERMRYEFYGYPPNFLELFRAGIEKVTTEDVNRVAKKYLHPEQMAILVVGNSREFGHPLSSLGTVIPIDVSIPGKPGSM
ncbi:MAG TPA: pitrilysin family protein [Candidatus Angelobacter sp.]|nr:pitrilysin family protein [Candidatus Angelobacter sp.]